VKAADLAASLAGIEGFMKLSAVLSPGLVLVSILGMSACATDNQPQSANQAVNQQRAATAASPWGYECYDDFGQPVYYYDAASPGFCSNRQVYVVQERPRPVVAAPQPLPSERLPLPVPQKLGVLGR
jgi:hypothetical protein